LVVFSNTVRPIIDPLCYRYLKQRTTYARTAKHRIRRHNETTRITYGRYVWLPVEWEGDKPVVRWRDRWTLADLDRLPCDGPGDGHPEQQSGQ
jgi:hypothetical protein